MADATTNALAAYQGPIEDPITRSEYWGQRSEDVRFPYPRTGFWQPFVEKGPEYYSPYGEHYTPPPYDPSWNENPDVEVFGDPKAFIDAELAQLMPAHPGSVGPYLGVIQGGPQTETQQAPWRGITYQRGNIPGSQAPSDFGYYRDMTDMLAASGRLNAEDLGYRSTVDATDALREKQHAMSSDTFGLQAGLKAGLAKQLSPWSAIINPGTWGFLQKGQEAIKSLLGRGSLPEMRESEISNAARALEAYEAGQRGGYRGAALRMMPEAFAETLTAPGSTYDASLGGMSPVPDIPGITEMEGALDEALRDETIFK